MLVAAIISYCFGIALPFFVVTRYKNEPNDDGSFDKMIQNLFQKGMEIFDTAEPEEFSVMDGISHLLNRGNWFLGILVGSVSVVFPAVKIVIAILILATERCDLGRLGWWLERLGPWSLLDALVVALLVIAAQAFPLGTAVEPKSGFYYFTGAIVLGSIALSIAPERTCRVEADVSLPYG